MSGSAVAVSFGAGFVSFLAPCVLPLVPGYLSAVSSIEAQALVLLRSSCGLGSKGLASRYMPRR